MSIIADVSTGGSLSERTCLLHTPRSRAGEETSLEKSAIILTFGSSPLFLFTTCYLTLGKQEIFFRGE